MKSTRRRSSALPVSDGEFPPWALLHRPARRVLELPDIAGRVMLAYHEAGHAVALRAFGLRIWRAELLPMSGRVSQIIDTTPADDDGAGGFSLEQLDTLADVSAIGHAATAAAGVQAELLARNRRAERRLRLVTVTRSGSSDARLMAVHLAARFEAPTGAHYCQAVARAILCRHWAGVEAVTRHLYAFGSASSATIDNLLAAAGCAASIGIDWMLGTVDG